ncbi:excalibur calcium-binding domain-containing protein [Glycomyces luteolus]|uniref:Excalibur calcium-binding domain-containing protein n=1 Tax=Glycomyces luteolus TaxID=2670330 RepID=A0A9X3SUT9_9ACTN|nr:excalibur calcium-binding domain-containing protein [Glycomyces luteolus]MDA1361708.1 excalibur calcium-binding domain-containing protein [Glycomyces luteolus]
MNSNSSASGRRWHPDPARVMRLPAHKPAASIEPHRVRCGVCGTELRTLHLADRCTFCDAPFAVDPSETELIGPHGVVPFGISESDVDVAFRAWAKEQLLARGDFKREVQVSEKRSVYLPYWVGWTNLYSNYHGRRGHRVTRMRYSPRKGHYKVKETDWSEVSGQVEHGREAFSLPAFVPLEVIDGITEQRIGEVQKGWEFESALPFEAGLLTGHQALRYSVEPEAALARAHEARGKQVVKDIKRDIGGDVAHVSGSDTGDVAVKCRLVLVPAWIVEWGFAGKSGSVILNGQNGKGAGKYVQSAGRTVALVGSIGAVVALCCGIGFFASDPDDAEDPGRGGSETASAASVETPSPTPTVSEAVSSEPELTVSAESSTSAEEAASTGEEDGDGNGDGGSGDGDPDPEPEPTAEEPDPTTEAEEEESVYYENCDAARAAGADPIYAGEPGYASHLDRDGDGVGCE